MTAVLAAQDVPEGGLGEAWAWGATEYRALRARLDLSPNVLPTLAIVVLDLGLLAAAAALLKQGGVAAFLLSQVALAIVFFNSFGVLHECGHGSASASPALNTLLGHYHYCSQSLVVGFLRAVGSVGRRAAAGILPV